jgi:predicted Zn finger-like uncharacterized protein
MPFGSTQSLITRCPGCTTAFRASAEQLAARQGQVRCGRVFDARAHAIDTVAPQPQTAHDSRPDEANTNDESPYDATSFIVGADQSPSADAVEDGAAEVAPPPAVVAEEPSAESATDSADDATTDIPVEDSAPSEADTGTADEPVEVSSAAAIPVDEYTDESADASDAAGTAETTESNDTTDLPDEGDAPANEEPDRPFADVLADAAAERTEPEQEESQPDSAPVVADEAQPDDHDTPPNAPDTTDHADATIAAADEAVATDSAPEQATKERHDPIDVAVESLPPAVSQTAIVEPLELEFGPRRTARPGISKWIGIPGLIVLLMVLAGQIAYRLRSDLVLLFPSIRSSAVQLCDWAGCDLPSPQRAELMSIEASDLQADSTNPAVMVLSATLRNRAPFAQAQPALELTLTDSQDQPVARRVIDASDYTIPGAVNGVFPASSELPVKIYFEASSVKATGYRLYLFYP